MAFQKFTKDPASVLDYEWNWAKWLAAAGDTIATATFIADDGITVESSSHSDTAAIAWLSGGAAGQSYSVVCRITTTGGRVDDRTIVFKVIEL